MANTVTITSNVNLNTGKVQNNVTNTFTSTGSLYTDVVQTIGTSGWTQLSSSNGTQYSYIQFYTGDLTSSVTIAIDNAGTNKICSLRSAISPVAGFGPPSGSSVTYYAQSLPSASIVEIRGVPL